MKPEHRGALERARALHEGRQREEAEAAHMKRRHAMKTKKTAFGDRVTRFPSTEALLSDIEQLRQELVDLYDEAAAMKDRDNRMAQQAKPDGSRFPALEG